MSDSDTDNAKTAEAATAADSDAAADDVFSWLSNRTRLQTLTALATADTPPSFTDLYEATDEETTAGFAYHLRRLVGHYVEKENEHYRLTAAGHEVAQALAAGTYTDSVDRDPEPIKGTCPVCRANALTAGCRDNRVAVMCTDCDTRLLHLPFPPSGVRGRSINDLLSTFDTHHRHRLALIAKGVCPDCAGPASARLRHADPNVVPQKEHENGGEDRDKPNQRPILHATCEICPFALRVPVTLSIVEHSEVLAFYREHDRDIRNRPIWNLGPEWRESVLSTDPWAVRITTRLDNEELRLLVGDGPTVVQTERATVGDECDRNTADQFGGDTDASV